MRNFIKTFLVSSTLFFTVVVVSAQSPKTAIRPLSALQQSFVDLRFGLFVHFNIPTYVNQDWPDPQAPASLFNPTKLDCRQWARAAKSANMTYGCLTTKHHSGFCIWDTKTTDYSIGSSPYKQDVVRQFVDAFRAEGLKVMLYYSILDTHHELRPHTLKPRHITLVKEQLTELLTNYGPVEALIIDGWDAPWSRISYDDIPFEEIYRLVKKLQPNCILMDLNGAKYPADGLYYTDIKTYEMGAGQRLSEETNKMPALACLPLQSSWFWKTDFPSTAVKDPRKMVEELIYPLNKANCNFILNVAPNRDGLMDANALQAMEEIGRYYQPTTAMAKLAPTGAPIISSNLAKNQPSNSSWSNDMNIMDFANDDDFHSAWQSNPEVNQPWYEIDFEQPQTINTVLIMEDHPNITAYSLQYEYKGNWTTIETTPLLPRIKIHRFNAVQADKVRIAITGFASAPSITEFQLYNEKRDE